MLAREKNIATTPGPNSFATLVRALIRTKHHNTIHDIADDVLSMPPNTLRTRTTAWNNWLNWCASNRWPPLSPTPGAVLSHIRSIAARSTRPGGTTKQVQITFSFLADIDPKFDVTLPPTSSGPLAQQWIPRALFNRAVKGVVKRGTTRTINKQPYLDIMRVLESLKADTDELDTAAAAAATDTTPSPAHYRRRRDVAIASFAAVVPSRPAELAGLELGDVSLYVPTTVLGLRAVSARLHELSNAFLDAVVADTSINFHLVVELRRSKTDAELAGIPKRLQHAPGSSWSPARAVLVNVLEGLRLYRSNGPSAENRKKAPVFQDSVVSSPLSSRAAPLSATTISSILAKRALSATGVEGISGRGWRPAAASWLLACGVDKSTVVALGGWKSAKSLRSFYVRPLPLAPDQLASVLAILPTAINPARAKGAAAVAGAVVDEADHDVDSISTTPSSSDVSSDDDPSSSDDDDDDDDDDDEWSDAPPLSSPLPLPARQQAAVRRAREQGERKESARRGAHARRL